MPAKAVEEAFAAFVVAAVPLFIVIDPFASVGLFLSLTARHERRARYLVAVRAAVFATAVLLAFSVAGRGIMGVLGIELYSLQIGGGVLLVLIGLRMLAEGEEVPSQEIVMAEVATGGRHPTGRTPHDPSLVPLGLPMLAGPGAISQAIVQTTRFDAWVAAAAILAAMAVSLAILVATARASAVLGENARRVVTRIMGLLTVAFAVQYILDGITAWQASA